MTSITLRNCLPHYGIQRGKTIGSGTYATVYEADWKEKKVAIKAYHPLPECDYVGEREGSYLKLIGKAKVPHVVRTYGWIEQKGLDFSSILLMSLAPHQEGLDYTAKKVFTFAKQLLTAVHGLGKLNLIHGDIGRSNVCFDGKEVTLIDFNLCQFDLEEKDYDCVQARYYRAPEVLLERPFNKSIDIWSTGILLFEHYTGKVFCPSPDTEKGKAYRIHVSFLTARLGQTASDYARTTPYFKNFKAISLPGILSLEEAVLYEGRRRGEIGAARDLVALIKPMLKCENRSTAEEALRHPRFAEEVSVEETPAVPEEEKEAEEERVKVSLKMSAHFPLHRHQITILDADSPFPVRRAYCCYFNEYVSDSVTLSLPARKTFKLIENIEREADRSVVSYAERYLLCQRIETGSCISVIGRKEGVLSVSVEKPQINK